MPSPDASTPTDLIRRAIPGLALRDRMLTDAIDRSSLIVERAEGVKLFDPGSSCGGFLMLDRGVVRVTRIGPDGRELLLYRVTPQETCVLTLACLVARSEYPARGVVERAIHGAMIPIDYFDRLVAEEPAFRAFVYGSFAGRLTEVLDLAAAVAFTRLDRRIANSLVRHVDLAGGLDLELTHRDLAGELGSTREPVSRLLEFLEEQELVALGRGRIVVRDRPRLEAFARGDLEERD